MKQKILFCGTPIFAVASLQALFKYQEELNYTLAGVVTINDKIAGRGQKIKESAVKQEAKKLNLKVYTPHDLTNPDFIAEIKKIKLDLIIVVAFKKLPSIFFEIPEIGTINLHASILPAYRGAAPINWAIINGESETGLTTFFINETIDTGDIILQYKIKIKNHWHANDLHDALMKNSSQIIKKTIQCVLNNNYTRQKQHVEIREERKYAPKIKKSDFKLKNDFWNSDNLEKKYNFIKGMSPPGVKTTIIIPENNKKYIAKNIIITRVSHYQTLGDKGSKSKKHQTYINIINKNEFIVTNNLESFKIEKIKMENGKELSSQEFYNGFVKNKNHIKNIYLYKI